MNKDKDQQQQQQQQQRKRPQLKQIPTSTFTSTTAVETNNQDKSSEKRPRYDPCNSQHDYHHDHPQQQQQDKEVNEITNTDTRTTTTTNNNTDAKQNQKVTNYFPLELQLSLCFLPSGDLGRIAAINKHARYHAFEEYYKRLNTSSSSSSSSFVNLLDMETKQNNNHDTDTDNDNNDNNNSFSTRNQREPLWIGKFIIDNYIFHSEKSNIPYCFHPNNPWISHAGHEAAPLWFVDDAEFYETIDSDDDEDDDETNNNNNLLPPPSPPRVSMWNEQCRIPIRWDKRHCHKKPYWKTMYYYHNMSTLMPHSSSSSSSTTRATTLPPNQLRLHLMIPEHLRRTNTRTCQVVHSSLCPLDQSLLVVAMIKFSQQSQEGGEAEAEEGYNDLNGYLSEEEDTRKELWGVLYDLKYITTTTTTTATTANNTLAVDDAQSSSSQPRPPPPVANNNNNNISTVMVVSSSHVCRLSNKAEPARSMAANYEHIRFGDTVRSGNGRVMAIVTALPDTEYVEEDEYGEIRPAMVSIWDLPSSSSTATAAAAAVPSSSTPSSTTTTTTTTGNGFQKRMDIPVHSFNHTLDYSSLVLSLNKTGDLLSILNAEKYDDEGSWKVYHIRKRTQQQQQQQEKHVSTGTFSNDQEDSDESNRNNNNNDDFNSNNDDDDDDDNSNISNTQENDPKILFEINGVTQNSQKAFFTVDDDFVLLNWNDRCEIVQSDLLQSKKSMSIPTCFIQRLILTYQIGP